jgi:hypothetical protein
VFGGTGGERVCAKGDGDEGGSRGQAMTPSNWRKGVDDVF